MQNIQSIPLFPLSVQNKSEAEATSSGTWDLLKCLDHTLGCRAAVQVHLNAAAVQKAGWGRGRGSSAVLDCMQLKSKLDRLKRQRHVFGLLLLKSVLGLRVLCKEEDISRNCTSFVLNDFFEFYANLRRTNAKVM